MQKTLRLLTLATLLTPAAADPAPGQQIATQGRRGGATAVRSAPVADLAYEVTFNEATARERALQVAMNFTTSGRDPVVLSLPAWTPGAYEISYFAKWVSNFGATGDGKPLEWDKLDFDTWRVRPAGAKRITVSFRYRADTLDNAMSWARRGFVMFNGTNLFLFPEGLGFDQGATVRVNTAPQWRVATGMTSGGEPRTFRESNYHDLVDMPFFVGQFDYDSVRVSDRWVRLASYPAGSVTGAERERVWDALKKMIPPQVTVFGDVPFRDYTILQLADSSYGGASGLEHQNSHVDVISPLAIGHPTLLSLYAHEIFHAWNVKRLRPADLWPYQYADEQPTTWLWMSEGITDYYADLSLVRGGVVDSAAFFAATAGKMLEVSQAPPVALEDASLSTWIHPTDGTAYIYYPKGSLSGLLLDILIRDASDNKRSLDTVMRQLYQDTYKQGKGFTGDQWWRAVSAAAGGKQFADFNARYIEGREPFPWATMLPLAGMRLVVDTTREPLFGVNTAPDSAGVRVLAVEPGSAAAEAGIQEGDYLISIDNIELGDQAFGNKFRAAFASKPEGAPFPIRVRRGEQVVNVTAKARFSARTQPRIEADPRASAKAARIRAGILRGTTG